MVGLRESGWAWLDMGWNGFGMLLRSMLIDSKRYKCIMRITLQWPLRCACDISQVLDNTLFAESAGVIDRPTCREFEWAPSIDA